MTSKRQTLEQKRAAAAWMAIEQVTSDTQQKKYGTLARKLPAMIQMNGLGSTLAFLQSKGKNKADDGHTLIFNHLSVWVLEQMGLSNTYRDKKQGLMQLVRDAGMSEYRRATVEAIEYGIWLKRYVEAQDWGSVQGDD